MCKNCLRRGTFCHQRQKVPKERCQNQWFWIPCAGAVREVSRPFTPANKTVQPRPVLSHCLGVYSPRRAPRLCCLSKRADPLCLPCGAGHCTLRNTIGKRCVGAGFYPARPCQVIHIFVGADDPVRPLYRAPYKNSVIAKSVRTLAAAIRIPVQLKNKHLTNPKNNPKMSVSFSSSSKRQRWGKGGDSPTRRESAAGASRWGSLAVLASELPA